MKTYPLARLPNGKKLLGEVKAEQSPWFKHQLCPPRRLTVEMCDADLGKALSEVAGKHDGVMEGRYRRAQVFLFEACGELIMATTERGDCGSTWYWLSKESRDVPFGDDDAPVIRDFWPQFVLDLNAALGWNKKPSDLFEGPAFERLVAKESAEQLEVLQEEVVSAPFTPRRRLR